MRRVGKALGWLVSLPVVAVFVALAVAVLESRPHRRQARRLPREQEREKRRKLENYELERGLR